MSTKTKYFLDTEFIENGTTIDLLSIGIVCEDGRTFYRQNLEANFRNASDWVWRNVFPHLQHFNMQGGRSCQPSTSGMGDKLSMCHPLECPWRNKPQIRDGVIDFMDIEKYGKPEVWGYYADYDWVAFCQLFGTMMNLPKGFPMFCMDLKQLCASVGDPEMPTFGTGIHNALSDAIEIQKRYEWIIARNTPQPTGL